MRLCFLCLLVFFIVSSAFILSLNTANAYEKENHYWLKIALALNCGFDIDQARLIAIGDFSIDDDSDTQPVTPGGGRDSVKWKWHALPENNPDVDKNDKAIGNQELKQRQHELYDRAMNTKNLSVKLFNFGQYLHYTEDKWGHWGYTTFIGHGLEEIKPGKTSPDSTHANPENYRYMVFDSMVNLGNLAKSVGINSKCQTDLLPLDTYHASPEYGKDFPWFSPQEIKRIQNQNDFKNNVTDILHSWKKSNLIDENIQHSKSEGASGVTENIIYHISQETGMTKEKIKKDKEFVSVDIDSNGKLVTSLYSYLRVDLKQNISEQTNVIPVWIKQNAMWWSEGQIGDKDFASGIGFLVKQNIIHTDIPISQDGSIAVSDNFVIPNWIRTNAKWWASDQIGDSDFTSGIEYMINQNIISFNPNTGNQEMNNRIDPMDLNPKDRIKMYQDLLIFSRANDNAMAGISEISTHYIKETKRQSDQLWDRYDSTNNKADRDAALAATNRADEAQAYANEIASIPQGEYYNSVLNELKNRVTVEEYHEIVDYVKTWEAFDYTFDGFEWTDEEFWDTVDDIADEVEYFKKYGRHALEDFISIESGNPAYVSQEDLCSENFAKIYFSYDTFRLRKQLSDVCKGLTIFNKMSSGFKINITPQDVIVSEPNPPTTLQPSQSTFSVNPRDLTWLHTIGSTECPQFLGKISFGNVAGTVSVPEVPSYLTVKAYQNSVDVFFNCNLSKYETQTLQGDITFTFTDNNNKQSTDKISYTGNIVKPPFVQ